MSRDLKANSICSAVEMWLVVENAPEVLEDELELEL